MNGKTFDISVVIPCYNAERWIERAIQSILDQEGVSCEIIVVDDGSRDNTNALIRNFDKDIKHIFIENGGPSRARNIGARASTSDFIIFLDADDFISFDYLRYGISEMVESNSDIGFGPLKYECKTGESKIHVPQFSDPESGLWYLFTEKFHTTSCAVFRKASLEMYGFWNETLKGAEDVEMFGRFLSKRARTCSWQLGYYVYGSINPNGLSKTDRFFDNINVCHTFVLCAHHFRRAGFTDSQVSILMQKLVNGRLLYTARRGDLGSYLIMKSLAKELGVCPERMSFIGALAVKLLGLRNKEKLSRFIHRYLNPRYSRTA